MVCGYCGKRVQAFVTINREVNEHTGEHVQIKTNEPLYRLGDTPFCSPQCSLDYYEQNIERL